MILNHRRVVPTLVERDRQREAWQSSPSIAERFPRAGAFAIALTFHDPTGGTQPSPMRQLFEPSMRAHFELSCPVRDCAGGGFDLQRAVMTMLSDDRSPRTGTMCCEGQRRDGRTCGLEVRYALTASSPARKDPAPAAATAPATGRSRPARPR